MILALWVESLRKLKREFYRLRNRPLYHLIGEELKVDSWSEAKEAVQLAASPLPTIAKLRVGSETVTGDRPYGGHTGNPTKRNRDKSRRRKGSTERRMLRMSLEVGDMLLYADTAKAPMIHPEERNPAPDEAAPIPVDPPGLFG